LYGSNIHIIQTTIYKSYATNFTFELYVTEFVS